MADVYPDEPTASVGNRAWRALLRARPEPRGEILLAVGAGTPLEDAIARHALFAEDGVLRHLMGDGRPKAIALLGPLAYPFGYVLLAPNGGRLVSAPLRGRIGTAGAFVRPALRGQGVAKACAHALGALLQDALSPAIRRDGRIIAERRLLPLLSPRLPLPCAARWINQR